jgi:hypothetical protein
MVVCPLARVDTLVTDTGAPPHMLDHLRATGSRGDPDRPGESEGPDRGLRRAAGDNKGRRRHDDDETERPCPCGGLAASLMGSTAMAEPVTATPGQEVNAVLLPKFLGILPFDQANRGAQEAAAELGSTGKLEFIGPTPENSAAGQIEMLTTATTQKQHVVMLSNNAGDQIAPTAEAAAAAGTKVVTWDSPIPNGAGEAGLRGPGRLRLDRHRDGRHGL